MKKYAFPFAALLLAACNSGEEITTTEIMEPVATIIEYTPAPGQFINGTQGRFDDVDTPDKACRYVEKRFAAKEWVSLGGWGGYIEAAFAEPVPNTGGYDIYVLGNSMDTSSEPGIVWVAQDADGDGKPDKWYELKGSEYDHANTIRGYEVTYTRPAGDNQPVAWTDNQRNSGEIERIDEHKQATYYPLWIAQDELTFTGSRLPDNVERIGDLWTAKAYMWGYADNYSTIDRKGMANRFRISDAVTHDGAPANLMQIDFIRVQTGVNAQAPLIGEISTEVCGLGCYRTVTKSN